MENQSEDFRQDQLNEYLDETSTEDVSADDLFNWIQNNQSNTNHQCNINEKRNFSNQDRVQNNFHPYESPSSTTNNMEQRLEYDNRNPHQFKMNNAGHSQIIRGNKEFHTIPNGTNNFVQTTPPLIEQTFIQTLFPIKSWEKIELPGKIDPNLMKMNNNIPINCNTNFVSVNPPAENHYQTQWQEKQSLAPSITQQNTQENLGNNVIPIIIDNQQPIKINEDILDQIKNQASGVRQIVKLRITDPEPEVQQIIEPKNPDPEPEVHISTVASTSFTKHSPVALKTSHKQDIIKKVVRTSSKKGKSRPSKAAVTKEKITTIISPHKRSTRNISTSKYAKLRSILEKLEDQETSPKSPTSQARKANKTLQDFQVEVAAIIKNDYSRMISRYNIHRKTSGKTQ